MCLVGMLPWHILLLLLLGDSWNDHFEGLLQSLQGEATQTGNAVADIKLEKYKFSQYIESEKVTFGDAVQVKIAEHQNQINAIFMDADRKFKEVEDNVNKIFEGADSKFRELEAAIKNVHDGHVGLF